MNKKELETELEAAERSARAAKGAIRALERMRRQGYKVNPMLLAWWTTDLKRTERRLEALKRYQENTR